MVKLDSLQKFEAQLMAEAIAAGQANLTVQKNNEKKIKISAFS
jgi:hypothetical protein